MGACACFCPPLRGLELNAQFTRAPHPSHDGQGSLPAGEGVRNLKETDMATPGQHRPVLWAVRHRISLFRREKHYDILC